MQDEFEAVYRTHVEAVFRYALRLTGDPSKAEDIVSEAFLQLFGHWGSIDTSKLPGWLLTVARNRAMDHWRKASAERPFEESVELSAVQRSVDLEHWLREEPSLKPIHRACLLLHFVHGMTRAEIANHLAVSESKVKGHLQYGLQLLRKSWKTTSAGGAHGAA
ncbi:MAG: sigma-70 family RNA polymerase sigma factor [Bryobacterales bacterium]|nr:sigma-70 family RNA polymerase sigma factor [Bryobacterales bacterium]